MSKDRFAQKRAEFLEMQEPMAYWYACNDPTGSVLRAKPVLPINADGYEPLYAKPFPAPKQEEK